MDHLNLTPALICDVSVGGMIAKALAVARPDLVAGLALCCTGARIADDDGWNARIRTVRSNGIAAMADAIMNRWFSGHFARDRANEMAAYRNMLIPTSAVGCAGVCGAIRDADFTGSNRAISVPTQCIAGGDDLETPVSFLESRAHLIPQASFEVIDACGHLPCIEALDRVSTANARPHKTLS